VNVRWGIMGTGAIAAHFAADLALLDGAELGAVGSRSLATAQAFAARFEIPRGYPSYAELVTDEQVDAIYVATPHPAHHACALLAIRAGKAVLIEKPFTLNASQARELITLARSQGTFLMEAMWTRFLPHMVTIRELVAAGRLGQVRSLTADLGGVASGDVGHRILNPALGGGALLDIGVYLVSLASMLFGEPESITATSGPAVTGVDAQTAVILSYTGGRQAVLFATIESDTTGRASINGTTARIEIDARFFGPATFRVIDREGHVEVHRHPHVGHGLLYEAAEVGRCLRQSRMESTSMPLDETQSVMETLDEIRRCIGLSYPAEH
jgi:predicted dehydrogenase